MEFEGIVVKRTNYKNDAVLVTVLTNEKLVTFLAKGVLKITSKNNPSVNLFTKSKFQVFHGKDGDWLRVGEIIDCFPNIRNDFEKLAILDFISELTNQFLDNYSVGDCYEILNKTLISLNKNSDYWTNVLLYFGRVLKFSGYEITVNENNADQNKDLIKYIFADGVKNLPIPSFEASQCKKVLFHLIDFLNKESQIVFKSFDLLKKI